jgi:uncharacterized protein YndB with AHSA1/START domain
VTVINIHKDPEALTLTLMAEFDATPERIWQLWADPRQLERWWGPPSYPATVREHDLRPGGRVNYFMTGPTGDTPKGYWIIEEVSPPGRLTFRDGFANDDWTPNTALGEGSVEVVIESIGEAKSRMTITDHFADQATMEQMLAMGIEQGLREAVGQIDAILAESLAESAR